MREGGELYSIAGGRWISLSSARAWELERFRVSDVLNNMDYDESKPADEA